MIWVETFLTIRFTQLPPEGTPVSEGIPDLGVHVSDTKQLPIAEETIIWSILKVYSMSGYGNINLLQVYKRICSKLTISFIPNAPL